jgi:hypothetical protein
MGVDVDICEVLLAAEWLGISNLISRDEGEI